MIDGRLVRQMIHIGFTDEHILLIDKFTDENPETLNEIRKFIIKFKMGKNEIAWLARPTWLYELKCALFAKVHFSTKTVQEYVDTFHNDWVVRN